MQCIFAAKLKHKSAMKLKGFILSLVCLTLIPISTSAIEITIKNWGEADDRSVISSEPVLSQDEDAIYIYSRKQLDNLSIEIKDLSGNVVYSTVVTIPAGTEYPTSITSLPEGEYLFTITKGRSYIVGYFTK
jgi:hypothetical protein